jgi:hypothetical protein
MKKFMSSLPFFNKFVKGMFGLMSLNLLLIVIAYVFNSCQSNNEEIISRDAATDFLSALESNKNFIGAVNADVFSDTQALRSAGYGNQSANAQTAYLSLPGPITNDIQNKAANIKSIQDVADFIHLTNAIIQYEPSDPLEPIGGDGLQAPIYYNWLFKMDPVFLEYLKSLIGSAKVYLFAKGFTDQNIKDMLSENNAEEIDLVLFVMILSTIEEAQANQDILSAQTKRQNNVPLFFANSAFAGNTVGYKDYIGCALSAIGVDVLYALMGSAAQTWTVAALTKAFSAVAKRALGPIGAAVAIVSFGLCIADKFGYGIVL